MPILTEAENAYVDKFLGQWVKVTPKVLGILNFTGKGVFQGRVIGWHWYDGVVLHVQPSTTGQGFTPVSSRVAFDFDEIELI